MRVAESAIATLRQHGALAESGEIGQQGFVVLIENLRALRAP